MAIYPVVRWFKFCDSSDRCLLYTSTGLYTGGGNSQYHDFWINGTSPSSGDIYRAYADNGAANINVRGDFIIPLTQGQTLSLFAGPNGGTLYGSSSYHHTYIQIFQIN